MTERNYAPPTKETTFLVSGGGKGITAASAIALAEAYQSRFILLGRSEQLEEEPGWAQGMLEEAELKRSALEHLSAQGDKPTPKLVDREVKRILSSREIARTIAAIGGAGGQAEYIQADITDQGGLKSALSGRTSEVDAILHGAGVLADKLIEAKTEADLDLVYGVKVSGLFNLLELIPLTQLKYLVLYSSVAGYYGNAGQSDYSLSNEALNKLAHHVRQDHPECQVLSIGWGPWDGGMVSPQLKRIFTRMNIPLIAPADGTRALVNLLREPATDPQVVIGDQLPYPAAPPSNELYSYRIARKLSLAENPFLADHVIGGSAVLPTVCAVQWLIQNCESLYPAYQFYSADDYKVFKGIVFDQDFQDTYLLDLQELEKDKERILFEAIIKSESDGSQPRFHYQARIELRREAPAPAAFTAFDLSPTTDIPGSQLYESKVLFHGPRFRGVKRVLNISDSGLTTECQLPGVSDLDAGQFPIRRFDPYLADVHLQSLLIWSHFQLGLVGLPLQIARSIYHRPVPAGQLSYATLTVKDHSSRKLIADVISHDARGEVFTEVYGAEITLTESLKPLFENNQLEMEPA